jgi:hypothetical protein
LRGEDPPAKPVNGFLRHMDFWKSTDLVVFSRRSLLRGRLIRSRNGMGVTECLGAPCHDSLGVRARDAEAFSGHPRGGRPHLYRRW